VSFCIGIQEEKDHQDFVFSQDIDGADRDAADQVRPWTM